MSVVVDLLTQFYAAFLRLGGTWARRHIEKQRTPLVFHNTLSGSKDIFQPLSGNTVRMYNCGPTVYATQHIGNLSMFVFADILRRTLEYNDYTVKQVINFTDVGHLSGDNDGDADTGEDRMTKGLKREGLDLTIENMKTLGKKYAEMFLEDLQKLNISTSAITFPYASDYIPAQVAMVQALEEKGYAYRGKKGVYFDTTRFPDYGKLGNINLEGLKEGARVGVVSEKKNPTDFLLWKLDKKLGWDSPWGKGFPGWHIECSAMSHSILGDQLDIHTGGIEHIPVHHNNEIAQSEAATGKKPFSRFWLHRAHMQIESAKIAKSTGNTVYLSDILGQGFHPLAFRYLALGAHYRTSSNFTWEALKAAQQTLVRIVKTVSELPSGGKVSGDYYQEFIERINDDLDTPGALAVMSRLMKDVTLSPKDIRATILDFDRVLGLSLGAPDTAMQTLMTREFGEAVAVEAAPEKVRELLSKREEARAKKDWKAADKLRKDIEKAGYTIEDTPEGAKLLKR